MEWGRCNNTREGTTRLCSPDSKLSEGIEFIMDNQLQFLPEKKYIKKRYALASKWRSFTEARKYVRSLELKSEQEWNEFTKGNISGLQKPDDIPCSPRSVYKIHGWSGFGDWLGIPPLRKMKYLPFTLARHLVRSLNINNLSEWHLYCRNKLLEKGIKPGHIPATPNFFYKSKWISWPDWFGNGIVEYQGKAYEPFLDARSFVHSLRFENLDQWYQYCRGELTAAGELPKTIPFFPHEAYAKSGWVNWKDWLGAMKKHCNIEYLSFSEAREFVRKQNFKSMTEWNQYCIGKLHYKEKPINIPSAPRLKYPKEWISWGDWLGNGNIATTKRQFCSYEDAKNFVRTLDLSGARKWQAYCSGKLTGKGFRPLDIPSHPWQYYKKEWIDFRDWLGTERLYKPKTPFLPFYEAREYIRTLSLASEPEWRIFIKGDLPHKGKLPPDIPKTPWCVYEKEWISWYDWLGNKKRTFKAFKKAKKFARSLKLKSLTEWRTYCHGKLPAKGRRPSDIPADPWTSYKKEWTNTGDWLGAQIIPTKNKKFRSFQSAREFVRSLSLKSQSEWQKYFVGKLPGKGKFPFDIPSNPQRTYKLEWISWYDWLGKS
jgi:hypothetical protein